MGDAKLVVPTDPVDAIRLRPAMYIGCADSTGLHNVLDEVIDFYLESVLRGASKQIEITLHTDGSCSFHCDGRGLPVTNNWDDGTPGLIAAFTRTSNPRQYPKGWGAACLSFLGSGLIAANALAAWFEVAVREGDCVWSQRFERGVSAPGNRKFELSANGSLLRWLPDPQVFRDATWQPLHLRDRLQTVSFLVPSVTFTLTDERSSKRWEFHHPTGLAEVVERLNTARVVGHPPLCLALEGAWGKAAVGLQYHSFAKCGGNCSADVLSFANFRPTEGGVHANALTDALTDALNALARRCNLFEEEDRPLTWPEVRLCLRAVISVLVVDAQWQGALRQRLGNEALTRPLAAALRVELDQEFGANEPRWIALTQNLIWMARFRPKHERVLRLRRANATNQSS